MMNFTDLDLKQIIDKGLTLDTINRQIELFKAGVPYTNIFAAATIGNGILQLDEEIINKSIAVFETKKDKVSLLKFVPASGAATRMFKFLFQFVKSLLVAAMLLGVIPFLLGLLFEVVVVVPIRVPLDQSPVFFPWQVSCCAL